ncbi:MAG: ABC transporter permease [Lachnospiraceae bacterium]|nr:ABC transporter permease [Lachnospiraceae bacterium]
MKISDLIKMGLRNLGRRKARTALTVIGVVIGTISIMLMVAIGQGLNYNFEQQIMQNGSMTIITIYTNSWAPDSDGNYQQYKQKLDDGLVKQIREIDHVRAVSPVIEKSLQLMCGKYYTWSQLRIMDCSTWADFGFPELESGSYPTPENNEVVVYGFNVLSDFSYYQGRVRKTKEIDLARDRLSFKFDDYWEENTGSGKRQFNYVIRNYGKIAECDDWMYSYYCYMDLDFYKKLYKEYAYTLSAANRKKALKALEEYQSIQINVDSMKNVTKVQEEIEALGYRTESDMQYIQPMLDTSAMLQKVFLAIGAVAFVVAAINIANTMIMSIYERTKEIGIMKVLGCYIRDIKKLFLFEAGIIGFIGGVMGVGLSYLFAHLLNKYGGKFLGSLTSLIGGSAQEGAAYCMIPFWLPFMALVVAIMVGVFSGYLPARRATKISAIEAMKSEG